MEADKKNNSENADYTIHKYEIDDAFMDTEMMQRVEEKRRKQAIALWQMYYDGEVQLINVRVPLRKKPRQMLYSHVSKYSV